MTPSPTLHPMVVMTLNLKRKIANMAKTAMNSDGMLMVFQTGICT